MRYFVLSVNKRGKQVSTKEGSGRGECGEMGDAEAILMNDQKDPRAYHPYRSARTLGRDWLMDVH